MICSEYTDNIDRYLFDQSLSEIDDILEKCENDELKDIFKQLKRDFENIYDRAYEQAEILNNIKMELEE